MREAGIRSRAPACARNQSLEWAAGQAGLSSERVRRWRRRLGLRAGLLPDEVAVTAVKLLARWSELPSARLTELVLRVTPLGEARARAAGA